jgi:hypothetical protein
MKSRFAFIIAILMPFLLLSACGAAQTNQNSAGSAWQIKLTVSGGLTGITRTAEYASTGKMSVTDGNTGMQIDAQVPAAELARLNQLLASASGLPGDNTLPPCNDCYTYALTGQVNNSNISLQANNVSLAGSGFGPLVNLLMDLQERASSGQIK